MANALVDTVLGPGRHPGAAGRDAQKGGTCHALAHG
jgi:hypothetical protein